MTKAQFVRMWLVVALATTLASPLPAFAAEEGLDTTAELWGGASSMSIAEATQESAAGGRRLPEGRMRIWNDFRVQNMLIENRAFPRPWGTRYVGRPIDRTRILSPRKYVALTFDDGPDVGGFTTDIARNLFMMNVPATFFLTGGRVLENPEDALYVAEHGHEIGSHGFEHARDWRRTPEASELQVVLADEEIVRATGRFPRWYRSPAGRFDAYGSSAVFRNGHLYANWTIGSLDTSAGGDDATARESEDYVVQKVLENGSGSIVLFHSPNPIHVASVPRIVNRLRAEGYEFVTLSRLAGLGYPVQGISR